jgi:hypothetical protein
MWWITVARATRRCEKKLNKAAEELRKSIDKLSKAVDKMQDGAEKTRLQKSLTALGTDGDENSVYVSFGALPQGVSGQTDPTYNSSTNQLSFNVALDPSQISGGNEMAIDAAHEGTHAADTSDPRFAKPDTTLDPFQIEYRGYQT